MWRLMLFAIGGGGSCGRGFGPELYPPPRTHSKAWSCGLWFAWWVSLAVHLGWEYLIQKLVTDSEVAACQLLALRVSTWLSRQQQLLRVLSMFWYQHPLVVEVHLLLGVLWPAEPPPSHLDSKYQSSTGCVCSHAFCLWWVLLRQPNLVRFVGQMLLR